MKILFLNGIYPEPYKKEIFTKSKRGFQFAAQKFQESLINGFQLNDVELEVVSLPFISTYPLGYQSCFINYDKFGIYNKIKFINLPILKEKFNNCSQNINNWCEKYKNEDVIHILVYSLNATLMKKALLAKSKYKNVKLSVIVLDLPEYMGCNPIYKKLGLQKRDINFIYKNIHNFDYYIFLTDEMKNLFKVENEKFCVVEGISINKKEHFNIQSKSHKNQILYTGALMDKYGIPNLLNAFTQLKGDNFELLLCGEGDSVNLINEYSQKDKRIKYFGKVENTEIIQLQYQATLLINPRGDEGDYTKYSFPSKTIEYMNSGTPMMMCKLNGVPQEYYDYCFKLDNNSVESIHKSLKEFFELKEEERNKKGKKAKEFILKYKNSKYQTSKIINLLNNANNKK